MICKNTYFKYKNKTYFKSEAYKCARNNNTYSIIVGHSFDLIIFLGSGKGSQAVRVQLAHAGVQLGSVIFGELSSKRIDGYDESSPVSLELINKHDENVNDRCVGMQMFVITTSNASHIICEVVSPRVLQNL